MVHLRRVHRVDAPWDQVWPRLAGRPSDEEVEEEEDGVRVHQTEALGPEGPVVSQVRTTLEPGIGSRMEWLDGPLAGSDASRTVIDDEGSTRVVLEGDFTVPEEMTEEEVLAMVEAMDRRTLAAIRAALAGAGEG